jgi:histidinol-phosphate phosphatase family protein
MKHEAVFMDRDGTIIKEKSYTSDPKDVELLPHTVAGIKLLSAKGFKLFVVTNQSGVSRGYFTLQSVYAVHNRMIELLKASGAFIDKIYFCPHSPEDNCECRKPKQGMIKQALQEFEIDLSRSYMIGDRSEDIGLGKGAGMKTILVLTGYGKFTLKLFNPKLNPTLPETGEILSEYGIKALNPTSPPHFIAKNLLDAARWICRQK